jgi:hypothetical protein
MKAMLFVSLVLVGVVMAGPASAASIPITNFSFEDPPQADGGFTIGPVVTGWVVTGSSGVFNPTAGQLSQGPTDGLQVGYSNETGLGLSQTLTGVVLTANTLYTLKVDVQSRSDAATEKGSTLQLTTAGGFVLASNSVGPLPASTNFLLTTIFSPLPGDTHFGQTLRIALVAAGTQSDWDNVRLDATAVPEPATMFLGGIGLVAFGYAARRRLFGR